MRLGIDVGGLGPSRSGVARYLWQMTAGMMKAAPDLEVVLYTNTPVDVPLSDGSWHVRVDKRAGRLPHFLWLQHCCPRLMAEDGIDAFWGQNWLMPVRLRRRCFRLLTVHDAATELFPRTASRQGRLASRLFQRRAVRAADCIAAVSSATARLAQLCLGADVDRIRVVYPGFAGFFRPVEAERARFVAEGKFGLPPEYMLTVGNIEPRKDHVTLLRALELTPHAPVLAIVGGIGWQCSSIVEDIHRCERAGRVRFLGRVDDADLPALYGAARLSVYPSFYEGFGSPVLEAMACGCPVLCSWSSSLPEVGGAAARYFRPHRADDLARRLQMLLSDEHLLSEMRLRGVERATLFSYDRAAGQMLALLREAPGARW